MKKHLYYFLTVLLFVIGIPLQATHEIVEKKEDKIQPVVIIGSGVGALTSAVYLQRAGIHTLVVEGESPGGAIAQSPSVHNWPGEIEIRGDKLIEKIRKQAEHNGATFAAKEVTHIDLSKRPFTLTLRSVYDHEDVEEIKAKAVIIAMGSDPRLLGVPGESGKNGYWTRGVYSCAVCDGGLYKDKTVAVVGGGDSAIIEADYLSKIAKKVYVILRSDQFRTVETLRKDELINRENVEVIYNAKISEILGDGQKVTHLNLSTQKELSVDGVFVAIGANPNTAIFKSQLDLDEKGYIRLADDQATSVPGVFAVGDIVDPHYKQAITAAGDGARAALQVEHFLASRPDLPLNRAKKPEIVQAANAVCTSFVKELDNEKALYDDIGKGDIPLVVDFFSPYCNPCKQLSESFEKAAAQYEGKARFLKIDVTQFPQLAENYGVFSLPTLMIFDTTGKQVEKATGLKNVQKTLDKLEKYTK